MIIADFEGSRSISTVDHVASWTTRASTATITRSVLECHLRRGPRQTPIVIGHQETGLRPKTNPPRHGHESVKRRCPENPSSQFRPKREKSSRSKRKSEGNPRHSSSKQRQVLLFGAANRTSTSSRARKPTFLRAYRFDGMESTPNLVHEIDVALRVAVMRISRRNGIPWRANEIHAREVYSNAV